MNRAPHFRHVRRRGRCPPARGTRRGQALTEYLVVTAVLAVALLAPWAEGLSVTEHLLSALQRWYGHYALAIRSS